jgi:hypothetical protein
MNAFDYRLPAELCFPKPLFRINEYLADVSADAAAGYVAAILSWRTRVLESLKKVSGKELSEAHYLSTRAQEMLAANLAASWEPEMTRYANQSPYNLHPFPLQLLERQNNSDAISVLEALRWRAGIVDYLSDAPFAFVPSVELDECVAIQHFLSPVERGKLCDFCLTDLASEQLQSGPHKCALTSYVRAKWPTAPTSFQKWGRID